MIYLLDIYKNIMLTSFVNNTVLRAHATVGFESEFWMRSKLGKTVIAF